MKTRSLLTALLVATLVLIAAVPAAARPAKIEPPATVAIGKVAVGTFPSGLPAVLVPVRYPIQLAGRVVETQIALLGTDGKAIDSWVLHERLNSGRIHRPERRRGFTFVHRLGLREGLSRRQLRRIQVRVVARARLDLDEDGKAELRSSDRVVQAPLVDPRSEPLCSDIPHVRVRPGQRASWPLPVCDRPVRWVVRRDGARGVPRIRNGRLVYLAPKRFRGREAIRLIAKPRRRGAGASATGETETAYVQLTVGAVGGVVVRALGDSVTAGFGYYSDGSSMTIGRLFECRPGAKEFDDACSSNSLNTTSKGTKVEYAPDYGLANNVSWAAQWANENGITNYKNFAISGSEPKNWAPEGEFHETTEQIAAEDPDYILMTMGANPLLSEMLTGVDNMGCALSSQIFGDYRECIERAFAEVELQKNLRSLYTYLVRNTNATILLMQYHLSIPSIALAYSSTQIAEMGVLLNSEIEKIAAEVSPQRLQVVTPPHFPVGIDISPVYPSRYSCSRLGFRVDGPSVQSTPTQDELEVLHPLSFCEGPAGGGPPWVISGDTGIHPSAAGYEQMASQVPAPS